jgi:hypothetical protein
MGRFVRAFVAIVVVGGLAWPAGPTAAAELPDHGAADVAEPLSAGFFAQPVETDEPPSELDAPAGSFDLIGPTPDSSLILRPNSLPDATTLLFAGLDGWRHGAFAHSGLLWSPDGLERAGFTLKLLAGSGLYTFWSGALKTDVVAAQSTAFILPGWRFIRDKVQVTVFAGLDVQEHKLFPDDLSSRLRGQIWGARTGFDLWFQPSPITMVSADASASTVGRSYSARLAYGWRVYDLVYAGPEIGALGSDNYRQFRAGLHATGLQTGPLEWAASGGWARDSDGRGSLYGRLSVMARR